MSSFLWASSDSTISMSLSGFGISGLLYFSFSCSTSSCMPFGASCSFVSLSWISSFMDSLLSIGSIKVLFLWGFGVWGMGVWEFWGGEFVEASLCVFMGGFAAFGSVSSLWTSSEIDFAASAFTEIESMPCLMRNSTISGFEPACPQIEVSILCFLHSRITLEICFRTAQFISS